MKIEKIRVLLFDDVELLDFAGPMEIWSAADYIMGDHQAIDVKTISSQSEILVSKSLLRITPHVVGTDEDIDILIIPGGFGTRSILKSEDQLKYINALIHQSKIICSVCTGALILAKLNLLQNLRVTTHHLLIDELKKMSPTSVVEADARFIDQDCIITSAGVSAGIDMSLYMVEKLFSSNLKIRTAAYIEYPIKE